MARKKQQNMAAAGPVQGLWDVPAGWTWKRLGEVATINPTLPKSVADDEIVSFVPMASVTELTGEIDTSDKRKFGDVKKGYTKFVENDVLFAKITPCMENGKICVAQKLANGIGCGSTEFIVVRHADEALPQYIRYFLVRNKYRVDAKRNMQGAAGQLRVPPKYIRESPIPLPPTLQEQQRIVARIEELFAELDKAEEALQSALLLCGYYRQAVLRDAVSGELSKEWRKAHPPRESGEQLLQRILAERRAAWEAAELKKMAAQGKKPTNDSWKKKYKEPQPPNTAGLPELPEGWCWASFPQLGEFGRGKSKHRPRNDPKLYGGMYPFIQTGLVSSSDGVITHCTQTYNEYGLQQSKLWPAGTICITIAANIAHSAILSFPSCFPDSIVGLVVHKNISNKFIEYFIRTIRNDLEKYAPATAQKNINLEILYDVTVPIPPQQEQLYIEKLINDAFESIKDIQEKCVDSILMCKALRQSILNAAFTGKL